ncbi:hypothetical protein [Oryzobacter terrae]|uniref:hypothetical protein n=1 Tax=Oryzobacter terrae TaxID=1620385 RepID=UPI003671E06E
MGAPDDPRPIQYPSVLSILGKDHEQQWREKAHEQVSRANNSLAEKATFGGTPGAQKFAAVYAAALTEYTATLRGAQADLVTAAQNLATAAEEMRSRDENAGAAFVTLLARWTDPSGFESQQRQEEARESEESQEGATTLAGLEADDASAPAGTGPSPDMGTDPAPDSGGPVPDSGGPASGPSPTMATGPTGGPVPGPHGVA